MKKPTTSTIRAGLEENKNTSRSYESKTCGLVMPISAMDGYSELHWVEVKEIIKSVTSELNISDCELVSENKAGGLIHGNIVTNLYTKDLIICDVSGKNPNVLFELGLRLAFDKPTIIVKDDTTDYMFDTSPIFHLEYPHTLRYADINRFKDTLKSMIINVFDKTESSYRSFLQHFKIEKVSGIETIEIPQKDFIEHQLKQIRSMLNDLHYRTVRLTEERNRFAHAEIQSFENSIIKVITEELNKNSNLTIEVLRKDQPYLTKLASRLIDEYNLPKTATVYSQVVNQFKTVIAMWEIL